MTEYHRHTPTLKVVDGRGIQVSEVTYLCNETHTTPKALTTRFRHDINNQCTEHFAPSDAATAQPAFWKQITSLTGAQLFSKSPDAGWRLSFTGEAGQVLEKWDSRHSHWQLEYDNQLRTTAIREALGNATLACVERFSYADNAPAFVEKNQCGRLIRHDDPAGSVFLDEFDHQGNLLSQTRNFVKDPDTLDWPLAPEQRSELLTSKWTTTWKYSSAGDVLVQQDAKGNTRRSSYDVAGQLKKLTLQQRGNTETTVMDQVSYNPQGQVTSQTFGGKIQENTVYMPQNGRVLKREIKRTDGHILQKLQYSYDAVGNVLSVEDHSKPVQHNANQRISPISTYVYDSLYQLIKSTGREEQGTRVRANLPEWSTQLSDSSRLLNFTQHYSYDLRGNLVELKHNSQNNNYTRKMTVAADSNRALPSENSNAIPASYDANGNLQDLRGARTLTWNARNQLQSVANNDATSDSSSKESYLYDGNGMRVQKKTTAFRVQNAATYLPGLELRKQISQQLDVITLQAGDCNVRCLHWIDGLPSSITNDALRFTFDDHLGSSTLELDGQGKLISEEGYHPFGSTAWRAARNVTEAKFRTVRYSGKERDSTGLYYYGHRYYAPWLQRWISADPAGPVDGLNLYCMVGNNPVRFTDDQGLGKDDVVNAFRSMGRGRSREIVESPLQASSSRQSTSRKPEFSDYDLQKMTAHAYAINPDLGVEVSDAFNLIGPGGGPKNYRGTVKTYDGAKSPKHYLNFGSYQIENSGVYLQDLGQRYTQSKSDPIRRLQIDFDEETLKAHPTLSRTIDHAYELQQPVAGWIENHITQSDGFVPTQAGGPGAHAEVRALNAIVALFPNQAETVLAETTVYTDTLRGRAAPKAFIACHNCSGIIPESVAVPTGRHNRDYAGFKSYVRQLNNGSRGGGHSSRHAPG